MLKKGTAAGQSFFVGKLNSFLECRLSKITIYAGYAESTRKYLQKGVFFGIIQKKAVTTAVENDTEMRNLQ